ncbi:DciA family protein [Lamprobacter modestohalophilus]|uniref:DciA family protein n=1 Tax=Lamprobacter modestohalophilus TaxID=1064514 RepID=UPI002ADEEC4B|nr:DciA family protein [Lamprobacter modestohalophilus]MEA1048723.1 DciA family protein [Lamprobacter modestohalophilus]
MAKSTAHIRRHLRASQPIAALLDEIERRERLLSELRLRLPADLAKHCSQAALSAGELTLFVDSPVWADRFRFLCPELIGSVLINGPAAVDAEVKACKVRVLPPSLNSMAPLPRPVQGRAGVNQESSSMDEAGRSPLSEALERLARTLGQSLR